MQNLISCGAINFAVRIDCSQLDRCFPANISARLSFESNLVVYDVARLRWVIATLWYALRCAESMSLSLSICVPKSQGKSAITRPGPGLGVSTHTLGLPTLHQRSAVMPAHDRHCTTRASQQNAHISSPLTMQAAQSTGAAGSGLASLLRRQKEKMYCLCMPTVGFEPRIDAKVSVFGGADCPERRRSRVWTVHPWCAPTAPSSTPAALRHWWKCWRSSSAPSGLFRGIRGLRRVRRGV